MLEDEAVLDLEELEDDVEELLELLGLRNDRGEHPTATTSANVHMETNKTESSTREDFITNSFQLRLLVWYHSLSNRTQHLVSRQLNGRN